MILQRMSLENFRQFKGTNEIVFAQGGDNRKSPCITVLYGENGRGKTGIYRALMFGLYGEMRLSQDEDTKNGELHLVNRHLLEEDPETPVKSAVEVEFSHNGCHYHLRRELMAMKKRNGEIAQELGEVLLRVQDETGNTKAFKDLEEIRRQINAVLDFRVREYFLFDGEKIERLTRANHEQRQEVSRGIRNLLNIDDLEKCIIAAGKLSRELDQEVRGKSSGELQQIIQQLNATEDDIQQLKDEMDAVGRELKLLRNEKRGVDERLRGYEDIRVHVERREELEKQKTDLQESLNSAEADCRLKTPRLAFNVIQDTLQSVYENIDAKRKKGDIPPLLRTDLIEHLLKSHKCICGRELEEGSDPFKSILEWMSKTPGATETDAALQIWKQLSGILQAMPDNHRDAEEHLIRCSDIKAKLHNLDSLLEAIAEQIGKNDRSDAVELERMRERLEQNEISLSAQQTHRQEKLSEAQQKTKDLSKKREALEKDEGARNALIQRSQLTRQAQKALEDIFDSFKMDAAREIEKYATDLLSRLLDDEGKRNLRGVLVKEDYSLQIEDQWKGQFLANISAGQRQIMSIAFITALARAAAGEQVLEMPLFMDTPFGRLSKDHRNNLIREIPNLSSQWVLLATDTELRAEEGRALLEEKRLGRFYQLVAQADGTTRIREQALEEVPVLLKATMETA